MDTLILSICDAKVSFEVPKDARPLGGRLVWALSLVEKPGESEAVFMVMDDFGLRFMREPRSYVVIHSLVLNVRKMPGMEVASAFDVSTLVDALRDGAVSRSEVRTYSVVPVGSEYWVKSVEQHPTDGSNPYLKELRWFVPVHDDVVFILRVSFESQKLGDGQSPAWHEEALAFQYRVFNSLQVELPPEMVKRAKEVMSFAKKPN